MEHLVHEVDQLAIVCLQRVEYSGNGNDDMRNVGGERGNRGESVPHLRAEFGDRLTRNERLQLQRLPSGGWACIPRYASLYDRHSPIDILNERKVGAFIPVPRLIRSFWRAHIERGGAPRVNAVAQHPPNMSIHQRLDDRPHFLVLLDVGRPPTSANVEIQFLSRTFCQ